MGRSGTAPLGATAAQPRAHGSAGRDSGDGRLDPVRWRPPGRGTLIRLVAVAVLLATAAVVSWSPPRPCSAQPGVVTALRPSARSAGALPDGSAAIPGGSAAPAVPPGSVGVPVRLADPTALTLIRPGNRVDLLRRDDARGGTTAVAAAALVLDVTGASDPTAGGLLLALTPAEAERTMAAPAGGFAIVIRPG